MSTIDRVCVIGTGVIGAGWTARFLAAGLKVTAYDPAPDFGASLQERIRELWKRLEQFGLHQGATMENLTLAESLEAACEDALLVQESAPEVLGIKQDLHQQIEAVAPASALLMSSSSGLLPTEIQSVLTHPARFMIAHPFNPVYLLPLVELVGGEQTDAKLIIKAQDFYRSLGMRPLHVRREIEGYLSDRLQEAMWREILHLVKDGVATTGELDAAITYGPGLRWAIMGTCLTFHLAGGEKGMEHMLEQFGPALELPWTHLKAPELTDELSERLIDGTRDQASGRSVAELEALRDNCLIEMMSVLDKYQRALEGG